MLRLSTKFSLSSGLDSSGEAEGLWKTASHVRRGGSASLQAILEKDTLTVTSRPVHILSIVPYAVCTFWCVLAKPFYNLHKFHPSGLGQTGEHTYAGRGSNVEARVSHAVAERQSQPI